MKNRIPFFLLILSCFVFADSLWKVDSESIYSHKKNYKVGDAITILIDESTSAQQSGMTRSDKRSDDSFDFGFNVGSGSGAGSDGDSSSFLLGLESNGDSRFEGSGRTSRTSTVKTTITATVIDIQPNGNLFIVGQRQLRINNENEQVEISGVIRVSDINPDNTVHSSKIANAKVTVLGTSGSITDVQNPGFLKSVFGWLF